VTGVVIAREDLLNPFSVERDTSDSARALSGAARQHPSADGRSCPLDRDGKPCWKLLGFSRLDEGDFLVPVLPPWSSIIRDAGGSDWWVGLGWRAVRHVKHANRGGAESDSVHGTTRSVRQEQQSTRLRDDHRQWVAHRHVQHHGITHRPDHDAEAMKTARNQARERAAEFGATHVHKLGDIDADWGLATRVDRVREKKQRLGIQDNLPLDDDQLPEIEEDRRRAE
jgi:hypothetical protein